MRTLGLGEDLARNNHRLGEDVFASQLYSQVAKSGTKALAAAKVRLWHRIIPNMVLYNAKLLEITASSTKGSKRKNEPRQ